MPAARPTLLAGVALLTGGLLAGCEKPTPIVTLTSGGSSEWTEASRYCYRDGECREGRRPVPVIEVRAGEPVLVDVDAAVADDRWYVTDGSIRSPFQDDTAYRFDPASFPAFREQGRVLVRVTQGDGEGEPEGVWAFTLVSVT